MTFTCTIYGVDYRLTDSWTIPQQSGAVSTASIDILVPAGQVPPVAYSLVIISADSVPFFRGYISSITSPEYASGYEIRLYRLSVSSAESLLNNRLVSEVLTGLTATQIMQYLFDNYLDAENIELGGISDIDYIYSEYACQYQKLYDVIADIATDNDATFYISADNKFYFLARNDFIQLAAPETITGLGLEESGGDVRTVQIVSGATEDTSNTTEHVYWADGQGSYTLGYGVKSILGITINGSAAGVGVLGVDEENTAKTFLYNVGSNIITLNALATIKPTVGQLVVTVFVGLYDIDVIEINETLKSAIANLTGASGIIEAQFSDPTLASYATADAKALALLAAYDEPEQTASCMWRGATLSGSELLTMWTFNYPDLNIVGDYVITERTISHYSAEKFSISLKLKNKHFFQQYGTVLVRTDKQAVSDIKVYKNIAIGEKVATADVYTIDQGDFVFYPTDGSSITDPIFDNFYPGY